MTASPPAEAPTPTAWTKLSTPASVPLVGDVRMAESGSGLSCVAPPIDALAASLGGPSAFHEAFDSFHVAARA